MSESEWRCLTSREINCALAMVSQIIVYEWGVRTGMQVYKHMHPNQDASAPSLMNTSLPPDLCTNTSENIAGLLYHIEITRRLPIWPISIRIIPSARSCTLRTPLVGKFHLPRSPPGDLSSLS